MGHLTRIPPIPMWGYVGSALVVLTDCDDCRLAGLAGTVLQMVEISTMLMSPIVPLARWETRASMSIRHAIGPAN